MADHVNVSEQYVKDLEERNAWQQAEILRLTAQLPPHQWSKPVPDNMKAKTPEVAAVFADARDISNEEWREYIFRDQPPVFVAPGSGPIPDYPAQLASNMRIMNPVRLYVGKTTHRVVNAEGFVFILPAPGYFGCVIRVKPRDGAGDAQRF